MDKKKSERTKKDTTTEILKNIPELYSFKKIQGMIKPSGSVKEKNASEYYRNCISHRLESYAYRLKLTPIVLKFYAKFPYPYN